MKKLFNILVLSIVVLFSSCSNDEKTLEGDCTNPPKLSSQKLEFNKSGGTQEVTVNKNYRLTYLKYNDKNFYLHDENEGLKIIEEEDFITCEHEDFTIKKYKLKVVVVMSENQGEQHRKLNIGIASGNCFTGFVVNQE